MGYREDALAHWGDFCGICGDTLGLEVHHIDSNRENNKIENLMPLCGTCHNLVSEGRLTINKDSRETNASIEGLYYLPENIPRPDAGVEVQMYQLLSSGKGILEVELSYPLILLQDGVNEAFFVECHVKSSELSNIFDLEAVLNVEDIDFEEDELYKFNRELVIDNNVYHNMEVDAKNGRPFSDIVIEWNRTYRRERPFKVIGGQHRAMAIIEAVNNNQQTERYHGVRVFFGLSKVQRQEISLISNTNIAIPKALLDRIGEHSLGPESRIYAQHVGILNKGQDFAERQIGDNRFTVQLLRCLIVNYLRGKSYSGDIDNDLLNSVTVVKQGSETPDREYLNIITNNKNIWEENEIIELGKQYAKLHKKQLSSCFDASDDLRELRKVGFKYKVFTPSVTSAWAYVSGLLQRDKKRLTRHYMLYSVYDKEISLDPLNSIALSQYHHETYDKQQYRGIGTRQNPKDLERLVEIFLLQSKEETAGAITSELINLGVESRELKLREKETKEAGIKAKEMAKRLKKKKIR